MKMIPTLTLAAVLVFAMSVLSGCGQDKEHAPNGGSMDDTYVSFIDVGKGDCILLQSGDSAGLIDTGYDKTSSDVLSYLEQRGVSHLDWVILTHYDRDHVEGLHAIGKKIGIGTVFLPGYEGSDKNYTTALSAVEDLGVPAQRVTEKQHLKLGINNLDILPSSVKYDPGSKEDEGNDNDLSLVVMLTGNGGSYLFTGDLEEDGIAAYLKGEHGHFDVLKMPHHGKKSSGIDTLLEETKPNVAIITDSDKDPADKKVLKMLDAIGADVYRTGTSGTIMVSNDSSGHYSVSQ